MGFFNNVKGFNKIQNLLDEVETAITDVYHEFPTIHRQDSILRIIDRLNHITYLLNQIRETANSNSLAVQSSKYTFCQRSFTLLELFPAIEGMQYKIVEELFQCGVSVGKYGNEWKYC